MVAKLGSSNRKSNFELLRIVSMFLIVCDHYAVHGEFEFAEFTFNQIIVQILSYGGRLGVNIFVLISGYFLVTMEFKREKIVKLWVDVTIYSLIIRAFSFCVGETIEIKTLLKGIFPIPYSEWWFATSYFVLLLLYGYINILVKSLSKKRLDSLIIILTVICSILPTFFLSRMASSDLIWFILLYLIAARIRLYPLEKKIFDYSLPIGVGIYILCLLSCVIIDFVGLKIPVLSNYATYFAGPEKTTMLVCAIFLFIGFKNLKIKTNKAINELAATTFGIYLIHDHPFLREFLWIDVFNNAGFSESNMLILHALSVIVLTFVSCSLISGIYNHTIGKLVRNVLNKGLLFSSHR